MNTIDRPELVMGGRYRLGDVLGEGGMGTVHAAIDVTLGRPVAVKVLKDGVASDEHQVARFEREAKAAARLAHPNVVGVTELVRDPTLGLGLVMELLAGESLASRLHVGPLREGEAVSIFTQGLDGLAAAHAAGMIHRDLKPSNVFLVPIANSVLVKLLDFGIVKLTEEGPLPKLTRKGALVGTPTYMSPEQVACEPVDARSDVYSIGACLYEALVARPPYEAPHALALVLAVGAGPPRDLRELDPHISPDLVHVVRVAMARDPGARYQSAAAMRAALEGAVIAPSRVAQPSSGSLEQHADTGAVTRDAALPPLPTSSVARVGLGALGVVVLLALGWLLWPSPRSELPRPASAPTLPAPAPTHVSAPTVVDAPAPEALPSGIDPPDDLIVEPPEPSVRRRRPVATEVERAEPTPEPDRVRHLGEGIMDPFAH